MRYLFLLNPAAGRTDGTRRLRLEIRAALRRAGVREEDAPFPFCSMTIAIR